MGKKFLTPDGKKAIIDLSEAGIAVSLGPNWHDWQIEILSKVSPNVSDVDLARHKSRTNTATEDSLREIAALLGLRHNGGR